MARVLVCAGSRGYIAALQLALEHEGDITVAAACVTVADAMKLLPRVKPDEVIIDLEGRATMGIAAIEDIMGFMPVPILVLTGRPPATDQEAAAVLAAGALDVVAKSALDLSVPGGSSADALRHRVRLLSRASVIRHPRAKLRSLPPEPRLDRSASVIGICGSTGAPLVLASILAGLPADYPIPILVVQHISDGFTVGLARWLDETVPLPVDVAAGGAPARAGVHIAPERAHLKLAASGRLYLDRLTGGTRYRPSGDVLLASIAEAAGTASVAVVLSGIGRDGSAGAAAVLGVGGLAIAQDRHSSAVDGMPQAAVAAGVGLEFSPEEITGCLAELRHRPIAAQG
ncbi:MAG: response regulator receiver modulated CheB methylesterase [Actinomycetia bacterium]|jgi:two-component system chemotaxis response regulator CheB|nr:response regulator receiver modulated CheB methylesterase [Actinomycetes bacterium]